MIRKNYLSQNIRVLRLFYKLTQEELADKLNITRQTISSWECGKSEPSIDELIILSDFFNLTIEQLVLKDFYELNKKLLDRVYSFEKKEKNDDIESFPIGSEEEIDYFQYEYIDIFSGGFHIITNMELQELIPYEIDSVDLPVIMSLAVEMKNLGYNIIDIFGNGFSVHLCDGTDVENFRTELSLTLANCMSYNMDLPEAKRREEFRDYISRAYQNVFDKIKLELFGEYNYCWKDRVGIVRGWGLDEKTCKIQAALQGCDEITICKAFETTENSTLHN